MESILQPRFLTTMSLLFQHQNAMTYTVVCNESQNLRQQLSLERSLKLLTLAMKF